MSLNDCEDCRFFRVKTLANICRKNCVFEVHFTEEFYFLSIQEGILAVDEQASFAFTVLSLTLTTAIRVYVSSLEFYIKGLFRDQARGIPPVFV